MKNTVANYLEESINEMDRFHEVETNKVFEKAFEDFEYYTGNQALDVIFNFEYAKVFVNNINYTEFKDYNVGSDSEENMRILFDNIMSLPLDTGKITVEKRILK